MALVDARLRFTIVDIGVNGRISDGGVFSRSALYEAVSNNLLNLPPDKSLPGRISPLPYVIVAGEAFPLKPYIMKPFAFRGLTHEQQIYNYRLSRARRTVENAFGVLANRFRIFLTPINLSVDKVQLITKVACILHNLLLDERMENNNVLQMNRENFFNIPRQGGNNAPRTAHFIREEFQEYFNTNGAVPWQTDVL